MSFGLVYWILMLLWFIFGLYWTWGPGTYHLAGGQVLLFILLLILGWKVFGSPVHP